MVIFIFVSEHGALLNFCSKPLVGCKSGDVPENWRNDSIVCIPKKGNINEYDSWRGMTLLSIPGKMYNR